jgi:8-oxo-dGTP diphosphatase
MGVIENPGQPIVGIGAFVFDGEGRVLLVQRGKAPGIGLWSLPGGRLEPGETLVQGVAREVREETGIVVEVGTLSCVVEHMSDGYHFVILDYLARPIGGALAHGSDAAAAKYVDDAELSTLPLTNGLAELIARARATHPPWFTTSR